MSSGTSSLPEKIKVVFPGSPLEDAPPSPALRKDHGGNYVWASTLCLGKLNQNTHKSHARCLLKTGTPGLHPKPHGLSYSGGGSRKYLFTKCPRRPLSEKFGKLRAVVRKMWSLDNSITWELFRNANLGYKEASSVCLSISAKPPPVWETH